jgi:PKD repeat protein
MNSDSIYTRRKMGLDGKIWLVMLLTIIGCGGLMAYNIVGIDPCSPISVSIKGLTSGESTSFYVGEQIAFKATMSLGSKIEWTFGAKGGRAEGQRVTHSFYKEGNQTITVLVNGKCREEKVISIKKIAQSNKTGNLPVPQVLVNPIMGNSTTEVGKSVTFYSSVPADSTYEWIVLNSPNNPTFRTNQANYTFVTKGARTIQLTLDKDPLKVYTKVISVEALYVPPTVEPKKEAPVVVAPIYIPEKKEEAKVETKPADPVPNINTGGGANTKPEGPVKPKTKIIGNELFKGFLEDVIDKQMSASDFDSYLCAKSATKVLENGKWTDFATMCENIRGRNRIKLESVELIRDESNCVVSITVRYKKTLF